MIAARQIAFGKAAGEVEDYGSFAIVVQIPADSLDFGLTSVPSDGVIDWGDGTTESYSSASMAHTYASSGNYTIRLFSETNVACGFSDTSKVYEIVKWPDGITTPNATYYRSLTAAKSIAGSESITTIRAWTFYGGFRTDYGNDTSVGPFPNVSALESLSFSYNFYLKNLYLGGVITSGTTTALASIGSSLTADADGYKGIVTVGNTCANLVAITNFPFGAPTTTAFKCADGTVHYSGGSWIY